MIYADLNLDKLRGFRNFLLPEILELQYFEVFISKFVYFV